MSLKRPLTKAEWQFVGGLAVLIGCACAPSRPTPLDFSGSWAGTTSQGRPITYTVSPDLRITALTVEYAFGNCLGDFTLSPNVALLNTSGTAAAVVNYPPSGPATQGRASVNFLFRSITSADGTLQFVAFPTCGNANATWTATKR